MHERWKTSHELDHATRLKSDPGCQPSLGWSQAAADSKEPNGRDSKALLLQVNQRTGLRNHSERTHETKAMIMNISILG